MMRAAQKLRRYKQGTAVWTLIGEAPSVPAGLPLVCLTAMGEAINEVKSGQVDAVDLEKPVAEGYVAQNSDLVLASVALKVDDGDAKAVAMAKGNDKLKEAVNKVIKKLKAEGTYDEYIKDASKYTAAE